MENRNQDKYNSTGEGGAMGSAKYTKPDTDMAAGSADRTRSGSEKTAGVQTHGTDAAASAPTNGADDLLRLMEQSPGTRGLGQWMNCLRKPALSLQYTVEKRHVPDMDSDPTGEIPVPGANEDAMTVKGGFTIRYFDFAAGVFTLLVAGCVMKMICCVKRMM